MPWLSCFGNHEALNQGVGTQTPGLAAALTGGRKPTALPGGFDSDQALELFTVRPEAFMAGPSRQVPPDPGRRPITRGEFVGAHFRPGRAPARARLHPRKIAATKPRTTSMTHRRRGSSRSTPIAWPAAPRVPGPPAGPVAGGPARRGALGLPRTGREQVRTGQDDRLVILFSHHGIDTLTNTRGWHPRARSVSR